MNIKYLALGAAALAVSAIALADNPPTAPTPQGPQVMAGYGHYGPMMGYGGRGAMGMMGPMGLFSPDVVSQLKLTDAQNKQLNELQQQADALHQQMHATGQAFHQQMAGTAGDPAKFADAMEAHRAQMNAFHTAMQALAEKQLAFYRSLTPEQQKIVAGSFSRGFGPCGGGGPRYHMGPRTR
jgi:Spy/CpxP family protein refolding chaperone